MKGRGLQDVADVTTLTVPSNSAWSITPWSNIEGVDTRLTDIMSKAATEFARAHPGYSVQGFSGRKGRASGTPNHPAGRAIDVNIIGPDGKALPNEKNGNTFPMYEHLARIAKGIQTKSYPALDSKFAWGGGFKQGVALDLMHFDIGGKRGALWSFEHGLNKAGRDLFARLGYHDVKSLPADRFAGVPRTTLAPSPSDAQYLSPLGFAGETLASAQAKSTKPFSLAGLLSPVSSANAAEMPQVASLAPERTLARVSGIDVTPNIAETEADAQRLERQQGMYQPTARTPDPTLVSADKGPRRMTPAEYGLFAGMRPQNVPQVTDYTRVAPSTTSTPVAPVSGYAHLAALATPAERVRPSNLAEVVKPTLDTSTLYDRPPPIDPNYATTLASVAAPTLPPPIEVATRRVAGVPAARRSTMRTAPAQRQQPTDPLAGRTLAGVRPTERFSVNSVTDALNGRRGATAFSRSMPGVAVINRGPNIGTAIHNTLTGATTLFSPSGGITGVRFDGGGSYAGGANTLGGASSSGGGFDIGGGGSTRTGNSR